MPVVTFKGLGDGSEPIPPGTRDPHGIILGGIARYWVLRGGRRRILIRKMTDKHLLNTIAMLERNSQGVWESDLSLMMEGLATLQGEMATYYAEQELDAAMMSTPSDYTFDSPIGRALLDEAERRKLPLFCVECGAIGELRPHGMHCLNCGTGFDPSDDPAHDHS